MRLARDLHRASEVAPEVLIRFLEFLVIESRVHCPQAFQVHQAHDIPPLAQREGRRSYPMRLQHEKPPRQMIKSASIPSPSEALDKYAG